MFNDLRFKTLYQFRDYVCTHQTFHHFFFALLLSFPCWSLSVLLNMRRKKNHYVSQESISLLSITIHPMRMIDDLKKKEALGLFSFFSNLLPENYFKLINVKIYFKSKYVTFRLH